MKRGGEPVEASVPKQRTYKELSAAFLVLRGDPLPHHSLLDALLGHGPLRGQEPGHLARHLGLGLVLGLGRHPRLLRRDPAECKTCDMVKTPLLTHFKRV